MRRGDESGNRRKRVRRSRGLRRLLFRTGNRRIGKRESPWPEVDRAVSEVPAASQSAERAGVDSGGPTVDDPVHPATARPGVLARLLLRRGRRSAAAKTDARQPPQTPPAKPGRSLRVALRAARLSLVVGVLVGAMLGGYHGYHRLAAAAYFDVKRIEIQGVRRVSSDELRRMVSALQGRPIFHVDTARVGRTIASHPWVARATVERRMPDTLVVRVEEQRARASLLLGHLYLVDEEGAVFKRADPEEAEGLPVISGIDRTRYLEQPRAAARQVRRALAVIEEYYRQVRAPLSEVHLGDEDALTLVLRRGGAALRFGARFDEQQLRKLDVVWAALGDDRQRVRAVYLDSEVRPDRVVVRIAN